jgi:hypothetical protein
MITLWIETPGFLFGKANVCIGRSEKEGWSSFPLGSQCCLDRKKPNPLPCRRANRYIAARGVQVNTTQNSFQGARDRVAGCRELTWPPCAMHLPHSTLPLTPTPMLWGGNLRSCFTWARPGLEKLRNWLLLHVPCFPVSCLFKACYFLFCFLICVSHILISH